MKRGLMRVATTLAIVVFTLVMLRPGYAQDQGLSPGWFGLDSTVGVVDKKVDEGKAAIENATGISVSGFLDTSYTWSSNRPGAGTAGKISGRVFDIDHNDVVFNGFNLTLERPEPEQGWGIGGKVVADFGRMAELLREATFWRSTLKTEHSAELREAFLTTTLPIGNGLQVKGGLFVTLLGTEIIPNPGAYNDNISRSFLFGFAIPFRHLGALFTYPLADSLSITAGPVTGWDNPKDTNSAPSFLGGVTFAPNDRASLVTSVVYGAEQSKTNGPKRFAISNVLTMSLLDPLTVILEYTYGHEEKITPSLRDATWQGLGAIASYNWTDRFNTALRAEFFRDHDGARFGGDIPGTHADATVGEVTLTGAYKFTAKLIGRAEVRQDWSNRRMFQKRDASSSKNQTTLAVQAIYTF